MTNLVVIRVRGSTGTTYKIEDTLKMLGLNKVNKCNIIADTAQNKGMLNKVKDYVTWGELSEDVLKKLKEKGEPPFGLHPPVKGWGRVGIKKSFKEGGALGHRGEAINELIGRMV